MTKDSEVYVKCLPDFKFKKGSDKSAWEYGTDDKKRPGNRVHCTISVPSGKAMFTFPAGHGDMYFINLIIKSEDGKVIKFGNDSSGSFQKVKLNANDEIYPKKTDLHLFGNLSGNNLDEPSPFVYDYELINIHTGFVQDQRTLKRKKGFEKFKVLKNRPMFGLGPTGMDALNCKANKSASFWNGKHFACLKFFNLKGERGMRLTNETDARTRHRYRDFSCNRHKTFKSDGTCANCPKNCDTCTDFGLCNVC